MPITESMTTTMINWVIFWVMGLSSTRHHRFENFNAQKVFYGGDKPGLPYMHLSAMQIHVKLRRVRKTLEFKCFSHVEFDVF